MAWAVENCRGLQDGGLLTRVTTKMDSMVVTNHGPSAYIHSTVT